jgi:hypothetical protein
MKKVFIKDLKKGDVFRFNDTDYKVKQKYSEWKRDGEGYLVSICGVVFYFDELEVELVSKNK